MTRPFPAVQDVWDVVFVGHDKSCGINIGENLVCGQMLRWGGSLVRHNLVLYLYELRPSKGQPEVYGTKPLQLIAKQ
jgi:hypothetical protein